MSENMKLFLEKVSASDELIRKVSEEKDVNILIAMAKDMGITITAEDFKKPVEELNEDDLDVVDGGADVSCACAMGGGGTKDSNDKTCACVFAGVGHSKQGHERCLCTWAGYGYDS